MAYRGEGLHRKSVLTVSSPCSGARWVLQASNSHFELSASRVTALGSGKRTRVLRRPHQRIPPELRLVRLEFGDSEGRLQRVGGHPKDTAYFCGTGTSCICRQANRPLTGRTACATAAQLPLSSLGDRRSAFLQGAHCLSQESPFRSERLTEDYSTRPRSTSRRIIVSDARRHVWRSWFTQSTPRYAMRRTHAESDSEKEVMRMYLSIILTTSAH